AVDKGCELEGLSLDELRQLSPAFDQDFYSSITLEAIIDCHDVIGGTARARVRQALSAAKARLASPATMELETVSASS
ncbi:MAG: argH, partial [Acidobacteriaceae bacterium]|nr:argH [Acidobacteriaceae bacterium]